MKNKYMLTGKEEWSNDHENLLQYFMMNAATTTAPEDMPETERALRLSIEVITRYQAICQLQEQLMSPVEVDAVFDEALEIASNESDWSGDNNRVLQIVGELLFNKATKSHCEQINLGECNE